LPPSFPKLMLRALPPQNKKHASITNPPQVSIVPHPSVRISACEDILRDRVVSRMFSQAEWHDICRFVLDPFSARLESTSTLSHSPLSFCVSGPRDRLPHPPLLLSSIRSAILLMVFLKFSPLFFLPRPREPPPKLDSASFFDPFSSACALFGTTFLVCPPLFTAVFL